METNEIEQLTNNTMSEDMISVVSTTISILRLKNPQALQLYRTIRGNLCDPDYKEQDDGLEQVEQPKHVTTKAAAVPGFRSTQKAQTLADLNTKKRERVEALLKVKTPEGLTEIAKTNENFPELHSSRNGIFVDCGRWAAGIRAFDVDDDFLVSGLEIPDKIRPGIHVSMVEELLARREFWAQEMRKRSADVLRAMK